MYAGKCPFCHKELEHNRTPTGLSDDTRSHAGAWMWVAAGFGMSYVLLHAAGVPVPGLGEPSGFGGYALRFLGAAFIGAVAGGIGGMLLARHARGEKKRRAAFLASFDAPIPPRPRPAALPVV